MKCSICQLEGNFQVKHAGLQLCNSHFSSYIEKKAKQGIRDLGVFEKKGKIGIAFSGGLKCSVLVHILLKIAKERKQELIFIIIEKQKKGETLAKALEKQAKKSKVAVLLTGHCLDDFVQKYVLEAMARTKNGKPSPLNGYWPGELKIRHPAPLYKLYLEELEAYAKLKGLDVTQNKQQSGIELAVSQFIERLESVHPGTKHKMLKSFLELYCS
jgi:tRNA(Ile)-lysidine synthase TilS/MesJ